MRKSLQILKFLAFIALAALAAHWLANAQPLLLFPLMVVWGEFYKWGTK